MTSAEIDDVLNRLAQTKVDEQYEICYSGKGHKLNCKEDVKEFIDELTRCEHMTALRLEGNSFGVEAAQAIGQALEKHPEFQKAYWSDMFTGRLKNEIPNALEHLGAGIIASGAGLVELELSDNAFGPNGLRGLMTFLKSSACYTLKSLKLNNNGLGIFGGTMLAECLLECHTSSKLAGKPLALKVFVSGRNRLEDQGAQALAEALKAIGTLEEITMLQNFIQHEGVTALSKACLANKRLRFLNLNDNTFTEKGASSMAQVLPELPNLEVINFGDCLIRTDGAKVIAKSLTSNHAKLKELILNGNEIGAAAIEDLVSCVANKKELLKFDLNANEFGSEGVSTLLSLMEKLSVKDALQSLSEDEGDDEDDGVTDSNSEGDASENGVDKSGPSPHRVLPVVNGSREQTLNLADFLADPNPTKYSQLGDNGETELEAHIGTMTYNVDRMVKLFVVIAQSHSPSASSDETDTMSVKRLTNKIMQRLFEEQTSSPAFIIHTLLTHLGLIKNEDKAFVGPSDISATLRVLQHTVKQPFFTDSAHSILLSFVDKPNGLFDKCTTERHALLQTLYGQ